MKTLRVCLSVLLLTSACSKKPEVAKPLKKTAKKPYNEAWLKTTKAAKQFNDTQIQAQSQFRLKTNVDEAAANHYKKILEAIEKGFKKVLARSPSKPLEVWIFASQAEFEKHAAVPQAAMLYSASKHRVLGYHGTYKNGRSSRHTLCHEVTSALLSDHWPESLTDKHPWLRQGLCGLFSNAQYDGYELSWQGLPKDFVARLKSARAKKALTIEEVISTPRMKFFGPAVAQAQLAVWVLVQDLAVKPEPLAKILDAGGDLANTKLILGPDRFQRWSREYKTHLQRLE